MSAGARQSLCHLCGESCQPRSITSCRSGSSSTGHWCRIRHEDGAEVEMGVLFNRGPGWRMLCETGNSTIAQIYGCVCRPDAVDTYACCDGSRSGVLLSQEGCRVRVCHALPLVPAHLSSRSPFPAGQQSPNCIGLLGVSEGQRHDTCDSRRKVRVGRICCAFCCVCLLDLLLFCGN